MRWLLLALALMACSASSQQPNPKTYSAQDGSKSNQQGTAKLPLVVEVIPSEDAKKEAAENATERKEKLELDRNLVWFTGVLALIGLLQLLVFGLQARRLRQTIDEMKIATNAAEKATESYKSVERAWLSWVSVETVNFDSRTDIAGEIHGKGTGFYIRWINAGRTPAIQCRLCSLGSVIKHGEEIPSFVPPHEPDERSAAVIAPGVITSGNTFSVDSGDIVALQKKEVRIFIYGRVDYKDVFSLEPRHTEACIEVERWGTGETGVVLNFIPTGRQNRAT